MQKTDSIMQECRICPRECGADRIHTVGFCGAGAIAKVNLAMLHHGEEPVLSGKRGSGTIFFSHCNLLCVFCQNYTISELGWGKPTDVEALAEMMLSLQAQHAHNINFVSPTHYTYQIIDAIRIAKARGLSLPLVWNSNGYEKVSVLRDLEGIIDIYLPDLKYAYPVHSKRFSHAQDYPQVALEAICEMHRQVGSLVLDPEGIAQRGLIVRMLVLPNKLAGIPRNLDLLAERIGTDLQISLMAQYYPAHKALDYPEISRGITLSEYDEAVQAVQARGFHNVWVQELSSDAEWTPKFASEETDSDSAEQGT